MFEFLHGAGTGILALLLAASPVCALLWWAFRETPGERAERERREHWERVEQGLHLEAIRRHKEAQAEKGAQP